MHASTTGTCQGQGRVQGGTRKGTHSQGCTALHMYLKYTHYFRVGKRYKGIIPRGERPRAKRDVV